MKFSWVFYALSTRAKFILFFFLIVIVMGAFYGARTIPAVLSSTDLLVGIIANLSVLPAMFALITFGTSSRIGLTLLAIGALMSLISECLGGALANDYYFMFTERIGSLLTGVLLGLEIERRITLKKRERESELKKQPVQMRIENVHMLFYSFALLAIASLIYAMNSHLHILIDLFATVGVGLLHENLHEHTSNV
jgi:hypothetical protein